MCLGVPGQVTEIREDSLGMTMGKVSFAGVTKDVCLAYLPDVKPGDYVLVHVGFALTKIDEEEAAETLRLLREMGGLAELGAPPAPAAEPGAAVQGGTASQDPARKTPGPSGPRSGGSR